MKRNIIVALAISVLLISACSVVNINTIEGSGDLVSESRDVSDFNRIHLTGSGDLTVRQGDNEHLKVETDDNIIQYIETYVRNNTLYIEIEDGKSVSATRLRYTVDLIDLNAVTITGSGKVTAERLDTDNLQLNILGSGRVDIIDLTADSANMDVSGSGRIKLAGTLPEMNIDVSGSGNIDTSDLRCDSVDIDITGSGRVTVWATNDLHSDISGSGTVNYFGDPSTDFDVAGSGSFHAMGDK